MASPPSQNAPGLPNPYAQRSLPNPYASATVASAAPVKFTEEEAKAAQQKKAPAFHNPHNIKRPQAKKAGAPLRKVAMPVVSKNPPVSTGPAPNSIEKHGIDWYRSTADDDAAILEEKRQRQWEDKQRKKEQKKFNKMFGQWNPQAPHNPSRYSNLRAYKASGGYHRKKQGFNDFLKNAAAKARAEDDEIAQRASSSSTEPQNFPARRSFAPPTSYDSDPAGSSHMHPDRMQIQEKSQFNTPPRPPPESLQKVPPPPPIAGDSIPPPPPPPSTFQGATISAPPVHYANATISAPPVRYDRPDIQMQEASDEQAYDERPAKRPKISKAEAMMAKMGYKKGQGLGKNNDGVVTHLEVKMRKVPQGASASSFDDDGKKIKAQQVWDVRGGQRAQKDEPGRFGEESAVVVTWGCVEGVDWKENAERDDGGIRQEMGEAFSAKFGPVEHIQLDEKNSSGAVYIHFGSELSALNAVNRFDEGWEFRGRRITAQYYDARKFHAGIFDF